MLAIRVEIPVHLRTLTQIEGREITVAIADPATVGAVLDAVEAKYPVLCGTIRDHLTRQRRPFLRFYVGEEDWSHVPSDRPLPEAITSGRKPFAIIGAIAGG